MLSRRTSDASLVWKQLNGIISVFKPAGVKSTRVKYSVIGNLIRDMNQMKTREPRKFLTIECPEEIAGGGSSASAIQTSNDQATVQQSTTLPAFSVKVNTDLSDHVLAVGPRYQVADVRCNVVSTLGENTSGLLLLGLNAGTTEAFHIAKSKLLRCYHVHGRLGTGTEDNFPHTRITARSTSQHVTADKMAGLLASIQASHQKKMFELCGVDPQSQAAYDLAAGGLIRPADNRLPLLYGIRCVQLRQPDFVLEVHALNETEAYLGQLVQEIGRQLHTVAHCTAVRCVRHGQFAVDAALLRKEWTVQGVVQSLQLNRELLRLHPEMLRQREWRVTPAVASAAESIRTAESR